MLGKEFAEGWDGYIELISAVESLQIGELFGFEAGRLKEGAQGRIAGRRIGQTSEGERAERCDGVGVALVAKRVCRCVVGASLVELDDVALAAMGQWDDANAVSFFN